MNTFFQLSTHFPAMKKWRAGFGLLTLLSAIAASIVYSQSALPPLPLIDLPAEPLYMNGAKTKGNLTLALSVERPTVGQTYNKDFDERFNYVGYFDSMVCYRYVASAGTNGAYFDVVQSGNKSTLASTCGGQGFDGNFMNWATSSAIDILRYGLTGGHRTTDDDSTIIERAWLPDDFYGNQAFFPVKVVSKDKFNNRTELAQNDFPGANVFIYNCRNRIYFAKTLDATGSCATPFGVPLAGNANLVGNSKDKFFEVRNLVCDTASAPRRLMTYDQVEKRWTGLCFKYPSGKFKPVGQLQMNAESLRISVFSYLNGDTADNVARYGGVMRSPMKYAGPNAFDQSFNAVSGPNPLSEWNATTGVFNRDPQRLDAIYGNQGYPLSGAINYINRFGTLSMDPTWANDDANRVNYASRYKTNDPLSELYYEALRYLQGNSAPTASATASLTGNVSNDKLLTENFPAYRAWSDPFAGFEDDSGTGGKGCLRNSIVTVADVFTTYDRSVPGNPVTNTGDFTISALTATPPKIPALDVPFWTSVVGGFESGNAVAYTDSKGVAQTTSNLAANTKYSWLSNAATHTTGAGAGSTTATVSIEGNAGGSYHLAGMAYWANTQSFRTDLPKARVKTFAVDVNQGDASLNSTDFRRTRQIYLGAKYGGFDDSQTNNSGNPYSEGNNLLWQSGIDGDAKNYFLASDAQKFLDSLSELFARVVEETGSIAGGAISTQRLTVGQAGAVFQARFNPVANFWSGKLLKYPLSLDTAGTSLVIGSTETWEAGKVLTTDAASDNGASRNIVIGSPIGAQATVLPTAFKWTDLAQAHKDALNKTPYTTTIATDALGENRLSYLRGSRVDEIKVTTPAALFRPRDGILGDIVNSGLVYMGKPSTAITGTGYNTFFEANKTRSPVIFANANDGMLHAFYDSTGKEAFAYIPGFVAGGLNRIPDQDYSHFSINDSTPAVGEAYLGTEWRSVLVSGVGAGGQGVYALDVTNPASFSRNNVMWEFTDRDSPEMGNVIGTPKILKMRTSALNATPAYKYYAVVASGVNNYRAEAAIPNVTTVSATGNPSIFIIDLSRKPSDFPTERPWTEGTNFWRIELPQTSTAIAKGLVGFTTVENFQTGATESLYAGDLQGNVWKLDFTLKGTGSLTNNANANFTAFNFKAGATTKFFTAVDSAGSPQPITGEPVVTNAFFDSKVISFGTGKYLEVLDTTVPGSVTNTFYTLLDKSNAVVGRSALQAGSVSSGGTVTVPPFAYNTSASGTSTVGWYVDFDRSIGERQISDITGAFGQLFFGSLFPTKGSCGEGGGRFYAVNALTGNGISELSAVGILAAPLILEIGNTALTNSDTSGQRTAMRKIAVITQGSKGLKVAATGGGGLNYSQQVGRVSWRQLNNFQENKNN